MKGIGSVAVCFLSALFACAGLDFLKRQKKEVPADWTLPAEGKGATEELSK